MLADKESCVAAALETAKLISEKSPVAVQTTKESLNYSRDHPVKDSLNHVVSSTNMNLCYSIGPSHYFFYYQPIVLA